MENIIQFKGIRFNAADGNISKYTAPPYDVFNYGDSTDKLLRSNPHNIVHIQKPEGYEDLKYSNAADIFKNFLSRKILIEEKEKGAYVIRQKWNKGARTGLIASVLLDDSYKRIKPHEETKPGPISDRLKLTRAAGVNIGCIFAVFPDRNNHAADLLSKEMNNLPALYDFSYPENIHNKTVFSKSRELLSIIEDKTLYIADGHHRYRTMIDYRNYMRLKTGKREEAYEYTMMYLVPDSELTILPYHRLIKKSEADPAKTLKKIKQQFNMTKKRNIKIPPKGNIGMYLKDEYFILSPTEKTLSKLKSSKHKMPDAQILHDYIIHPILEIDDKMAKSGEYIEFLPGDKKTSSIKELFNQNKYEMAFLLSPAGFEDIKSTADSGRTMPPKSTYFYPKIPSGIVLRKCR